MKNFLQYSIQDLGRLKQEALSAMQAIHTKADAEGRELTDDENAAFQQHESDFNQIDSVITSRQASQTRAAKLASFTASAPAPSVATNPGTAPRVTDVKESFESDPNGGFRSRQEFMAAVMQAGITGKVTDERLKYRAAVGSDEQSGSNNQYGGFTVPEGFMGGLMMVDAEVDPIAGRTTNIPVSTPTIKVNARTDKNHTTSVTGGLVVSRRSEAATVDPSRMSMEQITLTANSLMGLSYATEELLADSPLSFAAIIANGFAQEMSSKILYERIHGTGAGEMEGILNTPALVTVSKETGQAADTLKFENVVKMYARLWGKNQGVWLANHETLPQLMTMNQNVGTAGFPAWQTSAREGEPNRLLGLPIYFTEYASALGDAGDLMLCNWSQYLEITLGGINTAESVHVRFVNNERAFRVTLRNDGRSWWRSALTPKKGAATLSPFVTLEAR